MKKAPASSQKTWWKYGTLAFITIQTSVMVLLLRYSRMKSTVSYFMSTAVFLSEIIKLFTCIGVIVYNDRMGGLRHVLVHEICGKPKEFAKMLVPALLYTMQNNLLFLALSNLDAATFQVTYQFKILTTAVFSVAVLGKHLSVRQWLSLAVLMLGVIMVQWPSDQKNETQTRTATSHLVGLFAVLLSSISSGFAGVYLEKLIKFNSQTLWTRNIQLAMISCCTSLFAIIGGDYHNVASKGFFYGYDAITWMVVLLQAVGGICISLVMKYADNILKGFATTLSIIISLVFGYYILDDFVPNPLFYLGTCFVLSSTLLYSM